MPNQAPIPAKTYRDYYPFGMEMPGRSYEAGGYRFGFNGQENEIEMTGVPGSHYSAEFWQYDSRTGRRWNMDPVVRPWESSFACFANDPIWFNDPFGDKWDPSNDSQSKADQFRSATNKQINSVNTEIGNLKNRMSGLDASGSEYAELSNQLSNLETRLGELSHTLKELDVLENSEQIYQLKPTWNDPGSTTYTTAGSKFVEAGLGGHTYFKNGKVVMEYGLGDLNTQAHELKHAYQFETGLLSFDKSTGEAGLLYDLSDEQGAFKRGSAFDGNIQAPLLNVSSADLIELGYSKDLPSISLNVKMLIMDVLQANYPRGFSMHMKYDGQTFDKYEEDITR